MQRPPRRKNKVGRDQKSSMLAYMRLAVAIVEQACKDAKGYYNAAADTTNTARERNIKWQVEEVKNFFLDERGIFPLCMPNTDGKKFYEQLMHNYEEYDYYIPPNIAEKRGGLYL